MAGCSVENFHENAKSLKTNEIKDLTNQKTSFNFETGGNMNGLETIIATNEAKSTVLPRGLNDSGSIQVQGDWSVLIGTPKGYVEARNLYGEKANFFSRDAAKEFSLQFLSSRVVRFHTEEWEQILAGVHSNS